MISLTKKTHIKDCGGTLVQTETLEYKLAGRMMMMMMMMMMEDKQKAGLHDSIMEYQSSIKLFSARSATSKPSHAFSNDPTAGSHDRNIPKVSIGFALKPCFRM